MKNRKMAHRPLALTAAATIALGGLFFGSPAYAEDAADQPTEQIAEQTPAPTESAAPVEEAPVEEAPPAEVVEAVDSAADAGVEIVAYGVNADGEDVIVVTEGSADAAGGDAAVKAFADAADIDSDVVVTIEAAPVPFADDDVVGGQGYVGDGEDGYLYACSIGFTAFAPDGSPALLSAGHCAFNEAGGDISQTTLTIPNQEPAVGGEGYGLPDQPVLLGTFGFAQHGGPGSSAGAPGDDDATDISVIDVNEAGGFTLLPKVTDWTTAGASLGSLADSAISVKSVGSPVAGSIAKSGRTTGFTTGTTGGDDITTGWANVGGHWVRGFSSDVEAYKGDSGGAVIQGNTAVGLISGGLTPEENNGVQWTWSTLLVHALQQVDGYEVALDLDAPVVTSPASGSTVLVGATVTGTAPGAASVEIAGVGAAFSAPVSDGSFSFSAPGTPGTYDYTLTSVNGHSRSASTAYTLTVEAAPTPVPVIVSPADGSTATSAVTSVSGTGVPTAAVVVTIDGDKHTTTVDAAGNWTVTGLELGYGDHSVSAVQTANDDASDAAKSAFRVVPAAPAITSIANGASFAHDKGPTALSGTGIDGATITVQLNGAEPAAATNALAAASGTFTATVEDGAWSVEFDAALQPGTYTATAVQSIRGVDSAAVDAVFSVLAAPIATSTPGTGGNGGTGEGDLAVTGGDMLVPLIASVGALILVAGGITLMVMRRRKPTQD